MPTVISLEHLFMKFGERKILQDINFSVEEGEFIAILGPNGAGKSTLLKLLLGLYKPSSGKIFILGKEPRRGNSDIGYAPQHRMLEADLAIRARDVVGFGLDGNKWGIALPSKQRTQKIERVLREVGIFHIADMPVGKLSGGQQQLLLIAQALLTDPKILLLDEPLSNIDIAHGQKVISLLTKISRERKITILLVTHDINPLLSVVSRVVYLVHGQCVSGKPEEVITSEKLSRLYGTSIEVIKTKGRLFVIGEEAS